MGLVRNTVLVKKTLIVLSQLVVVSVLMEVVLAQEPVNVLRELVYVWMEGVMSLVIVIMR